VSVTSSPSSPFRQYIWQRSLAWRSRRHLVDARALDQGPRGRRPLAWDPASCPDPRPSTLKEPVVEVVVQQDGPLGIQDEDIHGLTGRMGSIRTSTRRVIVVGPATSAGVKKPSAELGLSKVPWPTGRSRRRSADLRRDQRRRPGLPTTWVSLSRLGTALTEGNHRGQIRVLEVSSPPTLSTRRPCCWNSTARSFGPHVPSFAREDTLTANLHRQVLAQAMRLTCRSGPW